MVILFGMVQSGTVLASTLLYLLGCLRVLSCKAMRMMIGRK